MRETLEHLPWRLLGPFRGGRVGAVAGDTREDNVYYFGSAGGGVWKSSDHGISWRNVSDGFFRSASVGALAVAPSDPRVIYCGMGETTIRNNVSYGDGVYRSSDAGVSWQHLGLEQTHHIGRIRVHPQNPDIVFVAALGHLSGPNPERGVFRSTDGGGSWDQVLSRGLETGSHDVAMVAGEPDTLYAAFWQTRRGPSFITSGGSGSSLLKSADGGDSWRDLTRNPGMPTGVIGKIGVAVSPIPPERVWAIIEAEDGGLFRSDDAGASWECLNAEMDLRQRAFYFSHIFADPQSAEFVWILNIQCWKSVDGGQTFHVVSTPHADNHDLWIDPRNSQRMMLGSDGGASVSLDGGATWSSICNQPTGEFYHVTTDARFPYRVYGAQQDTSTISIPSRSAHGVITLAETYPVGGGESGHIAVRPDDPDIVYAGDQSSNITRYDHRLQTADYISVWPEYSWGWDNADYTYRFAWSFPILLSPHDPNMLYVAGNHLFCSINEGSSWEVISPDLTRHDPGTLRRREPAGETAGGEAYATISALAASRVEAGLIWTGSDDGLVHMRAAGGAEWENVTPPSLPGWAYISTIEASPHDGSIAYVAATRHRLDDFCPYLYRTEDRGQTWTSIAGGLPQDTVVRVVREDPARPGLLYAGTERGIFASDDNGMRWHRLGCLPVVPVHDLTIKGGDLVAATHGRGLWVLEELDLVRQIAERDEQLRTVLYRPRNAYRYADGTVPRSISRIGRGSHSAGTVEVMYEVVPTAAGGTEVIYLDAAMNPPAGVVVYYSFGEKPADPVTLTFLTADGREVVNFCATAGEKTNGQIPIESGLNRFIWDMRYPGPTQVEGGGQVFGVPGPVVLPGLYTAVLSTGEDRFTASFQILQDPRLSNDESGLAAQLELLLKICDKLSETHEAINLIRSLRDAEDAHELDVPESILDALEDELIQRGATNLDNGLNLPAKLNVKLAMLYAIVSRRYATPTAQAYEVFDRLTASVDSVLEQLQALLRDSSAARHGAAAGNAAFIRSSQTRNRNLT